MNTTPDAGDEAGPHLYQIGYWDREGGSHVVLLHGERFSEEELEAKVLEVAPDALARLKASDRWSEGDAVHVADFWDHIADLLAQRFGFREAEYAAEYRPDGWFDLRKDLEAEEYACPDDRPLLARLQAVLFPGGRS